VARKKEVTDLASCSASQVYDLANTGNPEALELLQKLYHEIPELARRQGNLRRTALESRLEHMLGDKAKGTALAVRENVKDLAKQVAGENPTTLERLLAERVATCWLDVQDHECRYAQQGNVSLKQYEWRSRMLDRAHYRYLSAIKTLAMIRKLSLPVVQVNIAEQQVNNLSQSPTVPSMTRGAS
jgi:hypothetical protein